MAHALGSGALPLPSDDFTVPFEEVDLPPLSECPASLNFRDAFIKEFAEKFGEVYHAMYTATWYVDLKIVFRNGCIFMPDPFFRNQKIAQRKCDREAFREKEAMVTNQRDALLALQGGGIGGQAVDQPNAVRMTTRAISAASTVII